MKNNYYNVSSVRLMRFLFSLGFDKESYINSNGKENWRFKKDKDLEIALNFYYLMRKRRINN